MPSVVPPIVLLARVPRRIPRVDVAIVAGLLAWALLEALLAEGPGSPAARALLAAGFTLPLLGRRRWPVPVLVLITLLAILRGLTGDVPEEGAMPFPAVLLASFSAALYTQSRWSAIAAAPIPIVAVVLGGFGEIPDVGNYLALCFISLTAWTAGFLIRRRAEQLAEARAQAPELAREAVASERARMARELHDVVAHSVTVISVQAGAAEELLEREPEKARGHLEALRASAHEALVELRRLVGVLREEERDERGASDDRVGAYAPQPGLERLDELLAEARAAGLPVELSEEGARDAVPAGPSLAAYRIAQESLTNVRRHAASAPTRVRVRYGEDSLELEIANAPGAGNGTVAHGSGHGLIGMRERARLYGGTLEAGPSAEGGFVVRARLPLEASLA
jgi:signal transduction histidine kinase